MNRTNNILILLCFLLPMSSWSQEEKDLSISDVEVVKSFKAELAKAKELSNSPVLPDTDLPTPQYTYTLNIDPLEINYPDPIIRPLAIKADPREDPKMFWLKAGYGNLKRPEVDLGYNIYIEDVYNISFWGSYEGGENDIPRSYSTLDLNLKTDLKLNDALEFNGDLFFMTDERNLFNSDSTIFEDIDLERKFTQSGFKAGISNNALVREKISYGIQLEMALNNLKQYESKRELVIAVPAHVSINLSENNLFTVFNKFESSTSDIYDNGVSNDLRGSFKTNTGKFSADLGVNLLSFNSENHLFPITKLAYQLSNINVYVGSDQKYNRNNLAGLYNLNPYTFDTLIRNDLSVTKSIYLGSQGKFSKLAYQGNIAYKIYDSIVDFNYSGTNDQRFFAAQYYDGNAISLDLSANYIVSSWSETGIRIKKLFYNLDTPMIGLSEVNLPDLEGEFYGKIYNNKKWQLSGTLNYRRYAINNISNTLEAPIELNNLMDLSFNGDYFFSENIGIYLSLNNVFNQNYERWYNYPDFGFNLYGGVKIKF